MRFSRRRLLQLATALAAIGAKAQSASPQDYPARPVRIVVGFPPGGLTDITARLIGRRLSDRLGQPFVVENLPGSATNIATREVIRAAPDGYTLLLATATNTINATVYRNLGFDFIRDVAPIVGILEAAFVMEVNPSFPAKTIPEFIAYAKANPGRINYGSGGIGAPNHVAGELFKMMAGIEMVHIPYRGSTAGALADLMGGRVQVLFDPVLSSVEYIKAGKLHALAVTTSGRSEALPDVPTIGEYLPGFEVAAWHGLVAPRNTPPKIIATLNEQVDVILADHELRLQLAKLGAKVLPPGSAGDLSALIAQDTERWAKVAKFAGITAE
jgi:tripartite-type tricarboxylate transporter receptor subunit TctC